MALLVWVAVVTLPGNAVGCAFHCRLSPCGQHPVDVVPHAFHVGPLCEQTWGLSDGHCVNRTGGTSGDLEYTGPQTAVDVRGRNITSISANGFTDCWGGLLANSTIVGVLLDNNPLVTLPNATSTGLGLATFVTMQNCSIAELQPGQLGPYGYTVTTDPTFPNTLYVLARVAQT
jgi:hypothetical protein